MNKTPTSHRPKGGSTQQSILGFVDSRNFETAKNRISRSEKREKEEHQRGSSSNSKPRKRKISTPHNTETGPKKVIMEDHNSKEDITSRTPVPTPAIPSATDPITIALCEMEERLTKNMQEMIDSRDNTIAKSVKDMIDPLKTDISSLVQSQKEWEKHKTDVYDLKIEKMRLNKKIQEVEEKNTLLEDRVRKLEDKLMESNLILHGIKESKWELDSTCNKSVIKAISDTVFAETEEKKAGNCKENFDYINSQSWPLQLHEK